MKFVWNYEFWLSLSYEIYKIKNSCTKTKTKNQTKSLVVSFGISKNMVGAVLFVHFLNIVVLIWSCSSLIWHHCQWNHTTLCSIFPLVVTNTNNGYFSCFMHAIIASMRLPFFKILSNFLHFCQNFQTFSPFWPFFWKIARLPLSSRIGPD